MAGIYIHIPFCQSRCTYCDFTSYPKRINQKDAYMACLYKEIKMRSHSLKDREFDTIYIGGGTPSILDSKYILGIINCVKKYLSLQDGAEITIEMNPNTVDKNKADSYLQAGVNRFSIGLQTANNALLQKLNRRHTADDFLRCIGYFKGQNISADILIGIENQTQQDIKEAIDLASLGGASHISMYALKAEEGTPLFSDYLNGLLPSQEEVATFYEFGKDYLKSCGFERYEVSNFCKDERYSKHNLNYWNRGEYIAFGISACSFIGGVRFSNTASFEEYIACILQDKFPVIFSEQISEKEAQFEKIMLSLRTEKGLNIKEFESEFKTNFESAFKQPLKKHAAYLRSSDDYIKIKGDYLFVQNQIIVDFLD